MTAPGVQQLMDALARQQHTLAAIHPPRNPQVPPESTPATREAEAQLGTLHICAPAS